MVTAGQGLRQGVCGEPAPIQERELPPIGLSLFWELILCSEHSCELFLLCLSPFYRREN